MEPDKIRIQQKVERSRNPVSDSDTFVPAAKLGIEHENTYVPVIVNEASGDKVNVTIADGPDTGVSASVDKGDILSVNKDKYESISKELF